MRTSVVISVAPARVVGPGGTEVDFGPRFARASVGTTGTKGTDPGTTPSPVDEDFDLPLSTKSRDCSCDFSSLHALKIKK